MGTVTGNGVITSDNSLDFKMLLKLSGGANNALGSLTGMSAGALSSGLPFLIEGKTSSPEFRPSMAGVSRGTLQNSLMQAAQGKNGAQGQQKPDLKGVLGGLLNKKKTQ